MSEMSKESVNCVLVADEREAAMRGVGAFFYRWIGEGRSFPNDVEAVVINMPILNENQKSWSSCAWTVSHKNHCGAQWKLSGTQDFPTLSPSLHWVGMWHGHLLAGRLESC